MTDQPSRNEVLLDGTALDAPVLSHENHGVRFYRLPLLVPRLSGQEDTLPLLIPAPLAGAVESGAPLRVRGQLRSFNNRSGQGSRLVLTVHVLALEPGTGEPCNRILLDGVLCKPPILRRTPLGRSICDLMVAVGRRYGRADYLPVIAWGQLAAQLNRLGTGDALSMEGRVQSRLYTKVTESGPKERTAYEVSLMRLLDEEPPEPTL